MKLLSISICLLLITHVTKAQNLIDTIYFDEDWSICEKPVAAYYRVCTLNKESNLFYKGPVADYYINGIPEMSGRYDESGIKQGNFLFYNTNGKIKIEGSFKDNEMNGIWNYYDNNGDLKAQFNCNNAMDFVPLLIINNSKDTILKNGNGKFSFHTQKDLPGIFLQDCIYTFDGEVKNGKKDGKFVYTSSFLDKKLLSIEIYKDGEFKRGNADSYAKGNVSLDKPLTLLNLSIPKLGKVDNFYHSNIVFGFQESGDIKVINFLLNKEFPDMESMSTSFEENFKDFYNIIGTVLRASLKITGMQDMNYQYPPEGDRNMFLSFKLPAGQRIAARTVKSDIVLTIDTLGYLSNSTFKGNLTQQEIDKINYYLSRLSNLKPYEKNAIKKETDIVLDVSTLVDTSHISNDKNNLLYRYMVSTKNYDISAKDSAFPYTMAPQIEAKFPGGQSSWIKYLERNLNRDILIENRAPSGDYTVTLSFLVGKDGEISEVQTLNNPGYGTAKEAIRVIKHGPKWVPAVLDGKNVIYRQKQSITFQVRN